jgi:UDP-N-acetylmuramoyl-L-alanyl-D-glutamate--2,6-diaminopimelate ligase
MRLSSLLAALPKHLAPTAWVREDASIDPVIRGISYDSRRVAPGDLFVALSGSVSDGHDYVARAIELGAVAVMLEHAVDTHVLAGRPAVVVPKSRRALAPISIRFFGEPSSKLRLIGITGTNGKTSTTYLVESILSSANVRTGLIGTVEIRYASERIPAVNTTPESLDLQRTLRSMCTQNIEAVVMEVSSHGLELGRVSGCRFRVGAFTNLTQDHLDFHGDMESYLGSKALLFRECMVPGGHAVVNVDDPAADKIIAAAEEGRCEVIRCSRNADTPADVKLVDAVISLSGTRASLELPTGRIELDVPLLGDFNLENLVVACASAYALGVGPEAIAAGVAACRQVPGRMEVVRGAGSGAPTVIVDYAHTPDAVDKLLRAVRQLSEARLIAVFGCGGDRDRSKRPLMAEAIARHSDIAIATSDNPRTEDPDRILADVEEGLKNMRRTTPDALGAGKGSYTVMRDRREAIRTAIALARPGDSVVIAGKGHEDYQIIGRDKLPFDDRIEAHKALAEWQAPVQGSET